MTCEQMQHIIRALELMRAKPFRCMTSVEYAKNAGTIWLDGFYCALGVLGLLDETTTPVYREVIESRGWLWGPNAPIPEMKRRGLGENAMIDELLSIEIEMWQRRLVALGR